MKKALSPISVVVIIITASVAFANIIGSKHDFSPTGLAASNDANLVSGTSSQVCVYCHAPHNVTTSQPLWNRENPTTQFTLYSGINMKNQSFDSGFTSDSNSLYCMSCHDGQTNVNQVRNAGTATDGTLTSGIIGQTTHTALGGYDLSKNHPINFPVSVDNTRSNLHVGTDRTKMGKDNQFPLYKITGNRATDRSFECGTCHDVHNPTHTPFLRTSNNESALCLGCHNI